MHQIRQQMARVVMITPLWITQSWYPMILEMLESSSCLLPATPDLVLLPTGQDALYNETQGTRISCMAYLRESFTSRGISTEASNLLLSSWKTKTKSNYNSLFAKWVDWCQPRDRNPATGPIEDVINFLAYLHKKGYQYRSLNSYRSAISAVHAEVDGYPVGQHPLVTRMLKEPSMRDNPYPSTPPFGMWDLCFAI